MRIAEYKQIDERTEEYPVIIPAEYDEQGNLISEEHEEIRTRTVPVMGMVYRDITEEEEEEISKMSLTDNSARIDELKQKLSETDYIVLKIAEAQAYGDEETVTALKTTYATELEERKAWREQINELQAEG